MTELSALSISDLRTGLDNKDFSARDVVTEFLQNIEDEQSLNSYLSVCGERALEEATRADQTLQEGAGSALTGIPLALKDIILAKGLPATAGSKILENFIAPYNSTVYQKLSDAGAIILGKTNLDEFAMGSSNENSAFGSVKNPWNRSKVSGGSSGGSAAAVAAKLCVGALGTDTGGSIRQPASFCGVVGIKPTYGRVSRYGVVAFASSLDQVGPLARSVKDCAILTNIISGHDPHDGTSVDREVPDFCSVLGKSISGLRIGVPKEYFIDGVQKDVSEAVQKALGVLESLGATIVEISLPHTEAAVPTYYVIAPAEASSNLSRYDGIRYGHRASDAHTLKDVYRQSRSEGFGPEVKRRILIGTYVLSKGYYDAYYLRAQKIRTLIARDFEQAFADQCDVIASPVAPTTAFQLDSKTADPVTMYLNDIFTIPASLAGLPGMSVPCGFDSEGLPIGLQLLGRPWEEHTLFQVAHAYEQETEWHTYEVQKAKLSQR